MRVTGRGRGRGGDVTRPSRKRALDELVRRGARTKSRRRTRKASSKRGPAAPSSRARRRGRGVRAEDVRGHDGVLGDLEGAGPARLGGGGAEGVRIPSTGRRAVPADEIHGRRVVGGHVQRGCRQPSGELGHDGREHPGGARGLRMMLAAAARPRRRSSAARPRGGARRCRSDRGHRGVANLEGVVQDRSARAAHCAVGVPSERMRRCPEKSPSDRPATKGGSAGSGAGPQTITRRAPPSRCSRSRSAGGTCSDASSTTSTPKSRQRTGSPSFRRGAGFDRSRSAGARP